MIPHVPIRLRHGKLVHAISEGADSPTMTFCRRKTTGCVVAEGAVTCPTCEAWVEKRVR